MSESLIEKYNLRLISPDCDPGAPWWRAYADLEDDISAVLPYLNADLEGCDYNHKAGILLWPCENAKFALRPREIAVAPVESKEHAIRLIEEMVETVNATWSRRDEIEPDLEGKKPLPSVLEIFKMLPGTNCGECDVPTCMAFAAALQNGSAKPSDCPHISPEELREMFR